jgi:Fur family ferric uptake transcriptional regulator
VKKLTGPSLSDIASTIRTAGARVTPARVRVLGLLQAAHGPLTHGDIEEALGRDALPAIDRVTLYRVLDWLAAANLAHKATDAHGVFRFSAAAPDVKHGKHVHFRCTDCGGVQCLDMKLPRAPALPRGFRLTGMDLDIRGECAHCAGKHR